MDASTIGALDTSTGVNDFTHVQGGALPFRDEERKDEVLRDPLHYQGIKEDYGLRVL